MSIPEQFRSFRVRGFESRIVPAEALSDEEIAAWDNSCRNQPHLASPFFSPHYARAVARTHCRVYVCVILRQGSIVGFLPFQFRNALHQWWGCAERVGGEMTDYFGLIAEPGLRIPAPDLLRLAGLNHLYFTHLDESQLTHGLLGERPEVGLQLRLDRGIDYWTQQLRKSNPKLVSETERIERSLQKEHGALSFRLAEAAWPEPLQHMIRCKGEQYLRTGKNNAFRESWRGRVLEELAGTQKPSCAGLLSTLHAGGTWIASHFGIRSHGVLHYWFPVYNPAMRRFSPGRLLLKNVIQSASEAGIELVDRGAGDTHAKRQLTNQEHLLYRGAWYGHGFRSTAFRIHLSFKWRLGQLVKACGPGRME
jgi:CelD/BcsL family acetyltransferase involved in cellulose biosynthesis